MASTFRELTACGLTLTAQNGRLVVDGLDRLPPADAERLVALAGTRKPVVLVELGYACPYSDDYLAAWAKSHPWLVCCPDTKPYPWNWRYKTSCTKCETPCGLDQDK